MWSRMPMPPTGLGPCCDAGTNDTASTPNSCSDKAHDNCGAIGPEGCSCFPCPETPGSDCSRCANCGLPGFEPPCPSCQVSTHQAMARLLVIHGSVLTDHPVFLLFDSCGRTRKQPAFPCGLTERHCLFTGRRLARQCRQGSGEDPCDARAGQVCTGLQVRLRSYGSSVEQLR